MVYGRFDPGCCCGCILLVDEFTTDSIASYTQVTGTWTISGGNLQTTSASGLIVRNVASLTTNYTVEGKVQGDADTDVVGLVFGYTDDDNYYRLVLEVSDTDDFCGNLKLIKKDASVDSTLLDYDLMWAETDKLHKLSACVEEDYYPSGNTIYLTITFNNGVMWRFEVVDTTPLSGLSVGFMTDPNSGTAKFDSLIVREHENDDPKCPDCQQICLIAYYNYASVPWFSNTDHHCEWDGTGTVSSHILTIAGTGEERLKIPHIDGSTSCIVDAIIKMDTAGGKIRVHGANDTSLNGPYGELDFDVYVPLKNKIKVSNGTTVVECLTELDLDTWYHVRLCVSSTAITFTVLSPTIENFGISVQSLGTYAGPYAGLSNVYSGNMQCRSFYFYRHDDPNNQGEKCLDCYTICDVCEDNDFPPDLVVTLTDIGDAQFGENNFYKCGFGTSWVNGAWYTTTQNCQCYSCSYIGLDGLPTVSPSPCDLPGSDSCCQYFLVCVLFYGTGPYYMKVTAYVLTQTYNGTYAWYWCCVGTGLHSQADKFDCDNIDITVNLSTFSCGSTAGWCLSSASCLADDCVVDIFSGATARVQTA